VPGQFSGSDDPVALSLIVLIPWSNIWFCFDPGHKHFYTWFESDYPFTLFVPYLQYRLFPYTKFIQKTYPLLITTLLSEVKFPTTSTRRLPPFFTTRCLVQVTQNEITVLTKMSVSWLGSNNYLL